ncbi:MAG: acetylxylan esterase [Bacteroidetes bacterium]|nr:MAG: acetylxylan esterase [Bacteroidota bacterium]
MRTCLLLLLMCNLSLSAQDLPEAIYDEAAIPAYTLPPLLPKGHSRQAWERQRAGLIAQMEREMYGRPPAALPRQREVRRVPLDLAPAQVRAEEVELVLQHEGRALFYRLLLCLPADTGLGPVPVFLGLNFFGNQSLHPDPGIALPQGWTYDRPDYGLVNHRATENSRGVRSNRWPIAQIVGQGFGVATVYAGDFDPDWDDGFFNGVHGLMAMETDSSSWGSVAGWAWGLSRVMDYLETRPEVDAGRVAVIGHSRLGKAALWAGAKDERFAMVISNNIGSGGAALSRRRIGERLIHLNTRFPHWFCPRFHTYNEGEDQLPFDQHQVMALVAPRPLYVASASEDQWADPRGEALAQEAAAAIYDLYQEEGAPAIRSRLGYHLRPGPHDITPWDWSRYLDFARQQWGNP